MRWKAPRALSKRFLRTLCEAAMTNTVDTSSGHAPCHDISWRKFCTFLNTLAATPESWWQRIVTDPDTVVRVDETSIVVRLRGTVLATVERHGDGVHCRIAPEFLLRAHPGGRAVLTTEGLAPEPSCIGSLEELGKSYEHVRRRACQHSDRRQAILDRLFLRHSEVLAVDASLLGQRVDLVALSPRGMCVFFVLRRFADGDLRLQGRGGIAWRMRELDRVIMHEESSMRWVLDLMERGNALQTRYARRYERTVSSIHPHVRLLVVDFDHAQRHSALPLLRSDLNAGLDRGVAPEDMLFIGDPGNISLKTLFSGL